MTHVLWHPAVRWPITVVAWLAIGLASLAALRFGIVLMWGALS